MHKSILWVVCNVPLPLGIEMSNFLRQMTCIGQNSVTNISACQIYYSPTLFETMGLNYSMQLIMSGVLNVTQVGSRRRC